MAKTIETMGAMWSGAATTFYGFIKGTYGTLAPSGFDGNEVISLLGNTVDDPNVELVLSEANTDLTAITFSANYVGQANVAVSLTTVDGITFSGTSADMVSLLVAAYDNNVSINVYFETTNTALDTAPFYTMEHGGSAVPAVHEDGGSVRVGSPPASPISYPEHLDGWDSADRSTPHYPA